MIDTAPNEESSLPQSSGSVIHMISVNNGIDWHEADAATLKQLAADEIIFQHRMIVPGLQSPESAQLRFEQNIDTKAFMRTLNTWRMAKDYAESNELFEDVIIHANAYGADQRAVGRRMAMMELGISDPTTQTSPPEGGRLNKESDVRTRRRKP